MTVAVRKMHPIDLARESYSAALRKRRGLKITLRHGLKW